MFCGRQQRHHPRIFHFDVLGQPGREGVRSPGDALYWMRNAFVSPNNKDPFVCSMPVMVFEGDPSLRVRRDYGGPMMSLDQAVKELAQRGEADE